MIRTQIMALADLSVCCPKCGTAMSMTRTDEHPRFHYRHPAWENRPCEFDNFVFAAHTVELEVLSEGVSR
jgi:hypothetical protein